MNKQTRQYSWKIRDNKYSLKLSTDHKRDEDDRVRVSYTFHKNNIVLFTGEDFHPSPLYEPICKQAAISLLGFLTLKEGDTDKEYFENYTPAQLGFSQSQDCEELQTVVYDFENKG